MKNWIIGICAYNEERNIGLLLDNILSKQKLPENIQLIVVCSGCTDNTPDIVRSFSEKDARIKLVIENTRRGKASALNILFKYAKNQQDILFLLNADTIPQAGSLEKLVSPLNCSKVGATMGHPITVNQNGNLSDLIVHMIWNLHHNISLYKEIKFSAELCALRGSIIKEIPIDLATDEPFMELLIRQQEYKIVYVPDAHVYIKGPDNLAELFEQRRRIFIGHLQIKEKTGFTVSTLNLQNILFSLTRGGFLKMVRNLPIFSLGAIIETLAHISARLEFRKGKIPYVWKLIQSTKQLSLPTKIK